MLFAYRENVKVKSHDHRPCENLTLDFRYIDN